MGTIVWAARRESSWVFLASQSPQSWEEVGEGRAPVMRCKSWASFSPEGPGRRYAGPGYPWPRAQPAK